MNKVKITSTLALVMLGFFALNACFASALVATIDNPKMVLYKNITSGKELVFERSVIAVNDNNYSVLINAQPDSSLSPYLTLKENNITLEPGERKEMFYTIKIQGPGEYAGDILVTFRELETNLHLSLAQRLVIKVTEVGNKDDSFKWYYFLPVALVLVLLLSLLAKYSITKRK